MSTAMRNGSAVCDTLAIFQSVAPGNLCPGRAPHAHGWLSCLLSFYAMCATLSIPAHPRPELQGTFVRDSTRPQYGSRQRSAWLLPYLYWSLQEARGTG